MSAVPSHLSATRITLVEGWPPIVEIKAIGSAVFELMRPLPWEAPMTAELRLRIANVSGRRVGLAELATHLIRHEAMSRLEAVAVIRQVELPTARNEDLRGWLSEGARRLRDGSTCRLCDNSSKAQHETQQDTPGDA
jgi:hypothetical protein